MAPGRGYGAVLSELPSEGLLQDDLTWGEGVPALSRSTCQRVKVSICQGPTCLCHVSSGRAHRGLSPSEIFPYHRHPRHARMLEPRIT